MSSVQSCYLCKGKELKLRIGRVRDDPGLSVLECVNCGLVFLSSFAHVNEGFYEASGMHARDVSIEEWSAETRPDDKRRFEMLKEELTGKTVLDFGCGNGGFLLLIRNAAKYVVGVEPETRLDEYFKENSIEVTKELDTINGSFDYITLFHVLEHLPDPIDVLKKLSEKLNPDGKILIEVPNARDALLTFYENEAFSNFTYWSCHLYLFTEGTLGALARQAGLIAGQIRQVQRYPLSNHLYWLSQGKPGGHKDWHFIDSDELSRAYEKQLASIGACDTLLAIFSKNS